MKNTVVKVEDLSKRFGATQALDHVCFEVQEKEIHAIIGENGAGKSTLCKMLTGVYQPDEGRIFVFGNECSFRTPMESIRAGIGMLYQERNLIPNLTGAQNIALGDEPGKGGMILEKEITRIAEGLSDKLGIQVPLDVPVEMLGAGTQQIIEILRAFYRDPKFLILDEPTASLGEGEVEPFLAFIREMVNTTGISVIFISHKIDEVFEIADKITVFTDGRSVLSGRTAELTQETCIRAMLRNASMKQIDVKQKDLSGQPALLRVGDCRYDDKEHHLGFYVKQGEIVGFYGLVGSGRTECAQALFGLRKADRLDAQFDGRPVEKPTTSEMLSRGFIMTAEKRADGFFPNTSLTENVCSLFWNKLSTPRLGRIRFRQARSFTEQVLKKHLVKFSDTEQSINDLSGGNIQKVLIGRSIELENVKLLILDEPTNGIDLGAKNEIYVKMRRLVEEDGLGVIFISSELDELISVCERLYVFAEGSVAREFTREQMDKEKILEAAVRRAGA